MDTQNNQEDGRMSSRTRECAYDPLDHMIKITYQDSGTEELYLEVKNRVLWFQLYCEQHEKRGLIDDSEIQFVEAARMFVVTSNVFIDDCLVGKSIAAGPYNPDDPKSSSEAILSAATKAKGRALANAGFGTVNCSLEEGDKIPCDSGITIERGKITSSSNPMFAGVRKSAAESTEARDTAAPAKAEPSNKQAQAPEQGVPMTLAQAKASIVPIGTEKGKTLGELLALKPNLIEFYAGDDFKNTKYPQLKEACKIIIANR